MLRFCQFSLKIMEKAIEIREATKEDCLEIRSLIQELADFEEMPNGPKISYEILEKDGFGCKNPLFKCNVAICDGLVIGYALYFYMYSTLEQRFIHLEDLYVSPQFRKKYVGSRLFDSVAKKAFEEKCPFLDFSVLSWNPAQTFYKAKGSIDLTEMEGWHMYRLNKSSLQNLVTKRTNNYMYDIREARFDDFDAIQRLAQEAMTSGSVKHMSTCDEIFVINIDGKVDLRRKSVYYGYLVIEANGRLIGYALYCHAYSTWEGKSMYLQEFYVSPNEHRASMKDDLISAIAKKACDEKCSRMDFWVLDSKTFGKFYITNGAVDLTENEEWHLYRLFELTKKPI